MPSNEIVRSILGDIERSKYGSWGYKHLDNIIFKTSILHGNRNSTSGKKNNETQIKTKIPFFTSWSGLKDISNELRLGIALGGSIYGMDVNVGSNDPMELNELIEGYGSTTTYRIGPTRGDPDLDSMIKSSVLELDVLEFIESNECYEMTVLPELETGKDLIKFVDMLKELTGKPIRIRVRGTDIDKDLDHLLVTKTDSIYIDCSSGKGKTSLRMDPIIALTQTKTHMDIFRSKEKGMEVIIDTPIRSGMDVVKLICLGADGIGLDHFIKEFSRSFLEHKGIGKDILKNQEDILKVDWAEIGELFGEVITSLDDQVKEVLINMNITSISDLTPDHLITDSYDTASISGLDIAGLAGPLPMWRHRS